MDEIEKLFEKYAKNWAGQSQFYVSPIDFRAAVTEAVEQAREEFPYAAELQAADNRITRLEKEIAQAWDAIGGKEKHWIEHSSESGELLRDQLTIWAAITLSLERARAEEREACWDIVEAYKGGESMPLYIARAIRARAKE